MPEIRQRGFCTPPESEGGLATMGKFLAFKLEALEADNTKLVEYGNSFAFMMGAVDKLSAKVNKKSRVLNIKFKAMKLR